MHKVVIDHLGRRVSFSFPPRRIVSLCPSITLTLYDLGLESRIMGRTQFCIHPEEKVKQAVVVGGTKQVKYERIDEICPDLIIAEKEENPREMVERLAESYPVYVTDVENVEDALHMIRDLGELTDCSARANQMAQKIEDRLRLLPDFSLIKAAYFIWQYPYMVAGRNTFIHDMMQYAGLKNVFEQKAGRYPQVTMDEVREAAPNIIILSSEPFPFKESHRQEFLKEVPEGTNVLLADGEVFSWYGSKMLEAPDYFIELRKRIESIN